jgi:hypothetical protein
LKLNLLCHNTPKRARIDFCIDDNTSGLDSTNDHTDTPAKEREPPSSKEPKLGHSAGVYASDAALFLSILQRSCPAGMTPSSITRVVEFHQNITTVFSRGAPISKRRTPLFIFESALPYYVADLAPAGLDVIVSLSLASGGNSRVGLFQVSATTTPTKSRLVGNGLVPVCAVFPCRIFGGTHFPS